MPRKGSHVIATDGGFDLGNRFLCLRIDTSRGLEPTRLYSPLVSFPYADRPYLYRLLDKWETPIFLGSDQGDAEGVLRLTLRGQMGSAKIIHDFRVPPNDPYLEERLTVENHSSEAMETDGLAMGFARSLGGEDRSLASGRLASLPFLRDLQGRRGEYRTYSFDEITINQGTYCPRWPRREDTPEFGAEGWVWTCNGRSLLVAKHSPRLIEFSVLATESLRGEDVLRFGGASIWHGDPEEARHIPPEASVALSTTRYVLVEGGIREAYYAFRSYMESLGHGTPPGFDPPVHWNELYDNPLWWKGDSFSRRKELYTLGHMEEEAAKAREMGCESLYLDPGWDTSFGSSIWPPYRLKDAGEFVALMAEKYGLKVSLHMPLAVWCDATAYPLEAHRRSEDGRMLDGLCSASPAYVETKKERLLKLAEAGFAYYMFDGTAFTGECWDPSHGHSLPLRRSEHARSIHELAKAVHQGHPDLIIELHDPILGGVPERYAPMHYLHGLEGSFDEGWAFEYMWDPMEDLISGRAVSLYYYNLAYSLPLYLHIDLRKDNANALEFWWYASTCRHLGIGGKHQDPEVWDAHKRAMRTYMRLKRFYTQGIFLGLEEDVHLHHMLGERRAVLNVFNLDSKAVIKDISVDISQIGFSGVSEVTEGEWWLEGKKLSIKVALQCRSAKVVEIVSR